MCGQLVCAGDGNSLSIAVLSPVFCGWIDGLVTQGRRFGGDTHLVTIIMSPGVYLHCGSSLPFSSVAHCPQGSCCNTCTCVHTHTQSWERTGDTQKNKARELGKKNPVQIVLIIKRFDAVPYTQQKKDLHYLNSLFVLVWLVSTNQSVICNSGCCSKGFLGMCVWLALDICSRGALKAFCFHCQDQQTRCWNELIN